MTDEDYLAAVLNCDDQSGMATDAAWRAVSALRARAERADPLRTRTGEMGMTDYDWIKAEREHEIRMEKEKTEQARIKADSRIERWKAVAVAVAVIAVVGIIVGGIWIGTTQSSERRHEQVIACTESGGTIVDTTGGPLCLRLQEGTTP